MLPCILADVYLNMENSDEAKSCILEASCIFPVSPEVLCMVRYGHLSSFLRTLLILHFLILPILLFLVPFGAILFFS